MEAHSEKMRTRTERDTEDVDHVAADVAVVGAGNAGLCAALAARSAGARVVVLERAPREDRGGNSAFTDAAMRFAYRGRDEVESVVGPIGADGPEVDLGTYPPDQYREDLVRLSGGRADRALVDLVAGRSLETMRWLRSRGVDFELLYDQQAFLVDGVHRFWGGLIARAVGAGRALVDTLFERAEREGVEVLYEAEARRLLRGRGEPGPETPGRAQGRDGAVAGGRGRRAVTGVQAIRRGRPLRVQAGAVVLACGGFEADAQWRTRYLGPGWELARVRGTRYNTGLGLRMALEAGARAHGNWSGCHAVATDRNAPAFGDADVGDVYKKHSYPLGIVVNREGRRFVDEGADFRNYTYARYGREVLRQPGGVAVQVFDDKVSGLLRREYRGDRATRVEAGSLEALADRLEVDREGFLETVRRFNEAVRTGEFDPAVRDGKGTEGIEPPKSNWALPLDTPPFLAFPVTCGITFTFGGLRVDGSGRVRDVAGRPVAGLYAAGELVGGLFYENYPGGAGLTAGAVVGRTAGREAAAYGAGLTGSTG